MDEVTQLRGALQWCLEHGVKAVDYSVTGYWHHQVGEGGEIMPPACVHVALDAARTMVLNHRTLGKSV